MVVLVNIIFAIKNMRLENQWNPGSCTRSIHGDISVV